MPSAESIICSRRGHTPTPFRYVEDGTYWFTCKWCGVEYADGESGMIMRDSCTKVPVIMSSTMAFTPPVPEVTSPHPPSCVCCAALDDALAVISVLQLRIREQEEAVGRSPRERAERRLVLR
jgi:hypothetical protein